MIIKLSPLVHIEIVVKDAEAAYQFLHNAFGAEKIQEEFAAFLDSDFARVIHVGLGNVVLQFIQPIVEDQSWYNQLKNKGPGVHNLTFIVEDIPKAVQTLRQEGISTVLEFPLAWGDLIGPENVRPDVQPVFMMNTMEPLGFHLELTESPYKTETSSVLSPPQTLIGDVSPMLHIELVVNDVDETYQFLHKVFGSEKVEKEFASFLDSPFMRVMHINLGNVVLQYCQPLVKEGSWYEQLRDKGPGVHNITFVVPDMDLAMKRIQAAGANDLFTFPLDWGKLVGHENVKPGVAPVHMVNAMNILGFHLELGEKPTDKPLDFLYIDIV
jgi:catechol 2,3-dioxygenase-like lactoylglutathione lyase family enzyme